MTSIGGTSSGWTSIDDEPRLGIGLDIGGTSTKAGIVDEHGRVVAAVSLPTIRGVDGVMSTARDAVLAVSAEVGVALVDVDVVGVGIPGTVDPRRGTVHHAVNLGIGSGEVELAVLLGGMLGVPVHVENDVRAAALGADWFVAQEHRVVDDLAYLSIGTGIAAGYVEHGRVRRGHRLVAGEIGHIPVDPAGPACACGQIGCIEAIASGSAIERMWPTADGSAAFALHRAMRAGDVDAGRVWHGVIGGLSRAVLVLALTWDPEAIVISGGVASLGEDLREAIAGRLTADAERAAFLAPLQLGERILVVEPSIPLGPIGAVRAARVALAARLR
jgi:glucokinase